jgi:hemerythrin
VWDFFVYPTSNRSIQSGSYKAGRNNPDIEQHIQHHEEFRDKVSRMMMSEHRSLTELLAFMSDWLKEHLISEDHKYIDYLPK